MKKILTICASVLIIACIANAHVNFFFDGATRENGSNVDGGKWACGGWNASPSYSVNACYNNTWKLQPDTNGYYWQGGQAKAPADARAAFNPNTAEGMTYKLDLMDLEVYQSKSGDDLEFKMGIMCDEGYDYWNLASTGVYIQMKFDANQSPTNIPFVLYKKTASGSDSQYSGTFTNLDFIAGATVEMFFNATAVTVTYNGAFAAAVNHDLPVSSRPDWYTSFQVINLGVGDPVRAALFLDNFSIVGEGASQEMSFDDDFTGANGSQISSAKWFNLNDGGSGASSITNNQLKFSPPGGGWGSAYRCCMKSDGTNSFRLPETFSALVCSVVVADVEVTTHGGSGQDLILHTQWYPERVSNSAWNYNSTSLLVEVKFDVSSDGSATNVGVQAYRSYAAPGQRSTVISFTSAGSFVHGATFEYIIISSDLTINYNGSQVASSAHGIDFSGTYVDGVFPAIGIQQDNGGIGSIYIDSVLFAIPEPACLLGLAALAALVRRRR